MPETDAVSYIRNYFGGRAPSGGPRPPQVGSPEFTEMLGRARRQGTSYAGREALGRLQPRATPSLPGRAWDWATEGLVSPETITRAMTGRTPEQLREELQGYESETPTHAAVREFVRGVYPDIGEVASAFTSPASIALIGAGVAGALPRAASRVGRAAQTAARAVGPGLGVVFGEQGAEEAIPSQREGETPADALKRRLLGAGMLAMGGAAGGAAVRGLGRSLRPVAVEPRPQVAPAEASVRREPAPGRPEEVRTEPRQADLAPMTQAPVVPAAPVPPPTPMVRIAGELAQSVPAVEGRETTINTTSGDLPARYRVVEADQLQTSHDPMNFSVNPRYPQGVQERAYERNKNAQAETIRYAQQGKWGLYVNGDPTAVNGPSQSTPNGIVLGGNGRVMSLKRAYQQGTGQGYKQFLIENAEQFGVDPQAIRAMKR